MEKLLKIPTNCPACRSVLQVVNYQLFCRNIQCPAQSSKKLEAFAKKVKLKGLGPASISKLNLTSIQEIYELTEEHLTDVLGKIGSTIFSNIEKTKIMKFSTFLSSLSIPLIGVTAGDKISLLCNSLDTINNQSLIAAGIGEKARSSLLGWLDANWVEFSNLPIKFLNKKPIITKLLGSVCITGKLLDFPNRATAKVVLEDIGFKVVNTVSKKLNYLVDESNSSSAKTTKAEALNITITNMQYLMDIAGE